MVEPFKQFAFLCTGLIEDPWSSTLGRHKKYFLISFSIVVSFFSATVVDYYICIFTRQYADVPKCIFSFVTFNVFFFGTGEAKGGGAVLWIISTFSLFYVSPYTSFMLCFLSLIYLSIFVYLSILLALHLPSYLSSYLSSYISI